MDNKTNMRKIVILFSLMAMLLLGGSAMAQSKPATKLVSVMQKGKTVSVTLSSSKPFNYGGNRYMLYVGNKDFTLYEQSHDDGKNLLTFSVPAESYNNFKEGEAMYLTYGRVFREGSTQDRAAIAKQNKRCWSLGKYSKAMQAKATK